MTATAPTNGTTSDPPYGIGMKSESTRYNGVLLCSVHHAWKTVHGREARPLLLAYLGRHYPERTDG